MSIEESMIPKFRAWHKDLKQMFDVWQIEWSDYGEYGGETMDIESRPDINEEPKYWGRIWIDGNYRPTESSELELMQSTGFTDKEGVEIFEGDILCYDFVGGIDTYIIERSPDDNQLYARYLYWSSWDTEYLAEMPLFASVIVGNRWANPELLEARDE